MGFFRTLLAFTGYSAVGVATTWTVATRRSKFVPVPPNDYLLGSTLFARYNPEKNPALVDMCVRKIPLDKIKPEYLEKEGLLATKFCAGVWSGLGKRSIHDQYRIKYSQ